MLDTLSYHAPSTPLGTPTVSLGKEPPGSIKCEQLLDWLSNCRLVKKGSPTELGTLGLLTPGI